MRTLADDEDSPINYLGAQVSCTTRVQPRYSADSDLQLGSAGSGCLLPCAQVQQMQHSEHSKQSQQTPVWQERDDSTRPPAPSPWPVPLPRSVAVDMSLREAAELMQKLCDEDLSVSPPADWSPPTRPRSIAVAQVPEAPVEPLWKPRDVCMQEGMRDLRLQPDSKTAAAAAGDTASASSSKSSDSRRASSSSSGSRPASRRVSAAGDSTSRTRGEPGAAGPPSRKFNLPANPYAKIRGCGGSEAGDEDTSDYLVESLLAVAKSITEPGEEADLDKFDRTGELPKDYELFERSVLFGGAGGAGSRTSAREDIGAALGAALGAKVVMPRRARATARAADTAIASR